MMRVFPSKRRLKRLGIGIAILIALVLIANGLMAWRTDRRLQARLDAIRAAGDPASIAELAPEPIPDDQNAAAILKRLTPRIDEFSSEYAQFSDSPLGEEYDELTDRGEPPTDEQIETIRAIVDRYPDLTEGLENAANCDKYASMLDYSLGQQKFLDALIKIQGPVRSATQFLAWKMELDIADGQPEQAIELGLQILRLAKLYDNEPTMVSFLVSIAIRGIAAVHLYDALAAGPVSLEAYAALDGELARHDVPEQFVEMFKTERAVSASSVDAIIDNRRPTVAALLGWPIKKYQIGALKLIEEEIKLAEQPWYENRGQLYRSEAPAAPSGHGILADLLLPAVNAAFQANARNIAVLRSLRIYNALKQYEQQNDRRPESLDDLDLPASATSDPFTGEPLKLKDTPEGWVVYSVMHNGVDDGGDFTDYKDFGVAPPVLRPQ